MNKEKIIELKIRKGQKCWLCKKEIKKGDWCYNGHWWHEKCKEKDLIKIEKRNYQQGWVCPKCGSVWAIWVDRCKVCSPGWEYIPPSKWDTTTNPKEI